MTVPHLFKHFMYGIADLGGEVGVRCGTGGLVVGEATVLGHITGSFFTFTKACC